MTSKISTRSYLTSLAVIFAIMILAYVLVLALPHGEYARTTDDAGNAVIDMEAGYSETDGGLPFWKWLLSPFLVLGSDGSSTLIAVIAFLLIIGGVFELLTKCDLITYLLDLVVRKHGNYRYRLMNILILVFMLLGAFVGSFEEVVPLVPIMTALAVALGWDVFVGIGMSLVAVGCGFATGVLNPFTVGVAQRLASLPMFSGIWLRAVSFVLIYCLLTLFLRFYAKRIEKPMHFPEQEAKQDPKRSRALIAFAAILGTGILLVISSSFLTFLQDYTMIIVAVMFLVAGVTSSLIAGIRGKDFFVSFGKGMLGLLPAVLMILMASSVKYTLTEGKVLDTILHGAVTVAEGFPRFAVILLIYLLVLVMNFFIASGSAKAFLLIPLIVPMASVFGISAQLCVLAFAFGDGFSNVFYPTNPVLLISLGLTDTPYPKYVRFAWLFQLLNLVLTSGILLFGLAVGY